MSQLDDYKDRMRTAIYDLQKKKKELQEELVTKTKKENAKSSLEQAKLICGDDFHNIVDSLETKLGNDHRITSANDLEVQLGDEIDELGHIIKNVKVEGSMMKKLSNWLGKLVNED